MHEHAATERMVVFVIVIDGAGGGSIIYVDGCPQDTE